MTIGLVLTLFWMLVVAATGGTAYRRATRRF